jgi:tellurite methyltransferase
MPAADRQKWDAKYASDEPAWREPSAVLLSLANFLPSQGRALDIAGGAGCNAIWLAQRGLNVTIADVSPVGLALAQQRASAAGVTIQTIELDLEQNQLPPGPFDLILSICYLWRPLFAQFYFSLKPGGTLAVIQPTIKNLERNEKPPAAFLLQPGELRTLAGSLKIVHYSEDWSADNRHDAVLVAQKQTSH